MDFLFSLFDFDMCEDKVDSEVALTSESRNWLEVY